LKSKYPNIGDFKEVEVIELMVKPGDTIKVDQSLVTVESDKASMEIPSTHAGVVKELKIKVGDKVGEGSLLLLLDEAGAGADPGAGCCGQAAAASAPAHHRRSEPKPTASYAPAHELPRPARCRTRPATAARSTSNAK
jgi:pyruvate/2-oxoglutarate dehydrogenase complex dihydrolipoamide acyltransferase (E2) component